MATLTCDCPHCGTKKSGFSIHGTSARSHINQQIWHSTYVCNHCGMAVLVTTAGSSNSNPAQQLGDLLQINSLIQIVPAPEKIEAPDHLPDAVRNAFIEGCEILKISPSMATTSFRKSLELGLKDLSPEIDAWKLEKRIDRMAEKGLLTNDLKEWAHHLRLDGNEATHEGEVDASKQALIAKAISTRELTKFVLTYLFTLPGQIKAARSVE
jgi:hypothetical protein